jgi:hypothetical protein
VLPRIACGDAYAVHVADFARVAALVVAAFSLAGDRLVLGRPGDAAELSRIAKRYTLTALADLARIVTNEQLTDAIYASRARVAVFVPAALLADRFVFDTAGHLPLWAREHRDHAETVDANRAGDVAVFITAAFRAEKPGSGFAAELTLRASLTTACGGITKFAGGGAFANNWHTGAIHTSRARIAVVILAAIEADWLILDTAAYLPPFANGPFLEAGTVDANRAGDITVRIVAAFVDASDRDVFRRSRDAAGLVWLAGALARSLDTEFAWVRAIFGPAAFGAERCGACDVAALCWRVTPADAYSLCTNLARSAVFIAAALGAEFPALTVGTANRGINADRTGIAGTLDAVRR